MKRFALGLAALSLFACNQKPGGGSVSGGARPGGDTVVASYGETRITLAELDAATAQEMYQLRRQSLETMILKKLVGAEAKKAGKEDEVFLKEIAEKRTPPMSEDEAKSFYEQNKAQMGGRSFEEMKPMILERVGPQKQREGVVAYFEELKRNAGVQLMLSEPKVEVAATGPDRGPAGAPVTIVMFSDFQCPFCGKVRPTLDKVLADYAGKVRVVWRDFPLPFHDKAPKASEAGLCANDQGKFWQMHDAMFDHQDKLSPDELKASAKAIGLDEAKFNECLDKSTHAVDVAKNAADGKVAGVTGTPAFFINGHLLSGALPYEKFKEAIEKELKVPN